MTKLRTLRLNYKLSDEHQNGLTCYVLFATCPKFIDVYVCVNIIEQHVVFGSKQRRATESIVPQPGEMRSWIPSRWQLTSSNRHGILLLLTNRGSHGVNSRLTNRLP